MDSLPPPIRYVVVKTFWFFVRPLQITYWFLVRPKTRGVKSVIQHSDGSLLLVRLNYGKFHWTFPGGGVNRQETPLEAASRELYEETGVKVPTLTEVYFYKNNNQYKQNSVTVFSGVSSTKELTLDPIEIAEGGWFLPAMLPIPLAPSVTQILSNLALIKNKHL